MLNIPTCYIYLMNVDISTLLLGSGFALFIALLAWGNQIREPRKEIKQLEEEFRKEFDLKKSELNPLLRRSYENLTKSDKYTFMDEMTALISVMEKNTLKDGKDVNLLQQLKELNMTRCRLEKYYKNRYILSILLTFSFFILGIISIIGQNWKVTINEISYSMSGAYLIIVLFFVGIILINLIVTYYIEESFIDKIGEVSDLTESG